MGGKDKRSPTKHIWKAMIQRCTNPNCETYANYGARGIRVCERWKSFENFLADMGEKPDGLTLERDNNNGHYEPNNCRWATRLEQAQNTRRTMRVTFNGKTMGLTAWSRELGVSRNALAERLKKFPFEEVMSGSVKFNDRRFVNYKRKDRSTLLREAVGV